MLIVSSADENYLPHFASLLSSLSMSNPHARVVLLDCGAEAGSLEKLLGFAGKLGMSLHIALPDLSLLVDAWVGHLSVAAYARIFIAELFPEEPRALYIDADCIVLEPLDEVWAMDMEGAIIAGVHDPRGAEIERVPNAASVNYVNSGFLLLDLSGWRSTHLLSALIAESAVRRPRPFVDQTLINAVVPRDKRILPSKWNFFLNDQDLVACVCPLPDEVAVVHYSGSMRPWLAGDIPLGRLYDAHRHRTPFPLGKRGWRRPPHRRFLGWLLRRPKYVNLFRNEAALRMMVEEPYLRRLEHLLGADSGIRREAA